MVHERGVLTPSPEAVKPFTDGFCPNSLPFGRHMPLSNRPSSPFTATQKATNAGDSVRRSLTHAEEFVSISATIENYSV